MSEARKPCEIIFQSSMSEDAEESDSVREFLENYAAELDYLSTEEAQAISNGDGTSEAPLPRKKRLLKKAPDAPKRFKSAYICFVTEKMEDVKKSLPADVKVTEVMKMLAMMWKNLPPLERLEYERRADADKTRYFEELSHYTGPMQVPNKRQKKPADAPKRGMSAFLSYSQQMRPHIRAQHPELKNTDISTVLARQWHAASEEMKRPHLERELREREKYHDDMAKWRAEGEERKRSGQRMDDGIDSLARDSYDSTTASSHAASGPQSAQSVQSARSVSPAATHSTSSAATTTATVSSSSMTSSSRPVTRRLGPPAKKAAAVAVGEDVRQGTAVSTVQSSSFNNNHSVSDTNHPHPNWEFLDLSRFQWPAPVFSSSSSSQSAQSSRLARTSHNQQSLAVPTAVPGISHVDQIPQPLQQLLQLQHLQRQQLIRHLQHAQAHQLSSHQQSNGLPFSVPPFMFIPPMPPASSSATAETSQSSTDKSQSASALSFLFPPPPTPPPHLTSEQQALYTYSYYYYHHHWLPYLSSVPIPAEQSAHVAQAQTWQHAQVETTAFWAEAENNRSAEGSGSALTGRQANTFSGFEEQGLAGQQRQAGQAPTAPASATEASWHHRLPQAQSLSMQQPAPDSQQQTQPDEQTADSPDLGQLFQFDTSSEENNQPSPVTRVDGAADERGNAEATADEQAVKGHAKSERKRSRSSKQVGIQDERDSPVSSLSSSASTKQRRRFAEGIMNDTDIFNVPDSAPVTAEPATAQQTAEQTETTPTVQTEQRIPMSRLYMQTMETLRAVERAGLDPFNSTAQTEPEVAVAELRRKGCNDASFTEAEERLGEKHDNEQR